MISIETALGTVAVPMTIGIRIEVALQAETTTITIGMASFDFSTVLDTQTDREAGRDTLRIADNTTIRKMYLHCPPPHL